MRCAACNAYIPEGAAHCLECGAGLEPETVCQKCGATSGPRARFCHKCGAPVAARTAAAGRAQRFGEPISDAQAPPGPCPRCGSIVPAGVPYCPTCGTNQETARAEASDSSPEPKSEGPDPTDVPEGGEPCPKCGAHPRGTGRFCHNCGRFIGSDIEDIICPRCGSTNSLRYGRCQYCGADMPESPNPGK